MALLQHRQYERALAGFESALIIDRRLNRPASMLNCLVAISHIHSLKGNNEEALSHLREALALSTAHNDNAIRLLCMREIGDRLQERRDYAGALKAFTD